MTKKSEFDHGGARSNAGRKAKYNEPTKVIRVPESQVSMIKQWLLDHAKSAHLRDLDMQLEFQQIQPKNDKIYQIPMATERVAAGAAAPMQDHIDAGLDLNEYLIRNEASSFIVKANSLSMLEAGIDINDPLLVDRSIQAKAGDIVIAMIDNEFTVKRLMFDCAFHPPKLWLKAENPDFENIYIQDGQDFMIWGVVTFNLKPMR